ncbi:MAG: PQQ-binding-like beta-propeller repeat protein, partial [Verrucomicrobiota bacterium]
MKLSCYLFCLPIFATLPISSLAEVLDWRNGGNGQYPEAKPAFDWKKEVEWKTKLDSWSNASPILVDGKLFVTAEPATLICLDAKSGEVIWQKANDLGDLAGGGAGASDADKQRAAQVAEQSKPLERKLYRAERRLRRNADDAKLKAEVADLKKQIAELRKDLPKAAADLKRPPTNGTNGYSSYTPVSDGKHVWASFGMGVVVCYDLEGERIWHQRFEAPDHSWGGACSPRLVGDRLVVRFRDYHGLDPATGEKLWKTPSEGVVFNAAAYFDLEGKSFLITPRGELIRASDGKKVWSAGYKIESKSWSFHNTPSVIGNRVYFAHGVEGQQGDAYCLEIPSSVAKLEGEGLKQIWYTEVAKNRFYSSPLVIDGIVYLITRNYDLLALDAASGESFYEQKIKGLTGTAYPSLTRAGDVIVVGADD